MKIRVATLAILPAVFTGAIEAQYQNNQQPGLVGLMAGTQPAPGFYVTLPAYWRLNDISLYGSQGNEIAKNVTADLSVWALPVITVVTPWKILGANYGASYTQWITNGVLNVAALSVQPRIGYGFGDIYVQPVILGWHTTHADVTAAYGFFAPTGSQGHGFNMWTNEIAFGTTLYADQGKKFNVSTMMYYDINQKKNNQDIKVGDILTLDGGAAFAFFKGAAHAGAAYSAQWKVTPDSGSGIPPFIPISNGRVFGVGPSIQMPVFAKGKNVALVSFTYFFRTGAKTNFNADMIVASVTFGHLFNVGR